MSKKKKNWKLWNLFWAFVRKHKKDYRYFKKTQDIDYLFDVANDFCSDLTKHYDIKINVTYEDESFRDKQVLFVSNHQSMFDPLFVFQYINHPCGFFIASEFENLKKIKIIGNVIDASKCIYIHRNDIRKTALEIKKASNYVKTSNTSYLVFPEGRIKSEQDLGDKKCGDFLSGAFKIAKNNGLSIVPITIMDSEKIHNTTNYMDMLEPGVVNIHFHKPLTKDDYVGLKTQQIATRVQEIVSSKL